MTKVIVLLGIAAIVVAVSAHPLEENVADNNKESPEKVSPILAADKEQNKTTDRQDAKSEDDSKEHTSDSPESTEVYIEESYIAVLLPGIPELNTTELVALLNKTANTSDDDGVRSKRNPDNREIGQVEINVSPPTSGSTVPSVLYSLRHSNDDSAGNGGSSSKLESSQKESKANNSSFAAPPLYQLRNLNTRSADKDDGSSSKESSEEKSKGSKKVHDSSSSEESSEEKYNALNESTVASPSTPIKRSKRSFIHSSAEIAGEREKSSLNKNLPKADRSSNEAVNTKDDTAKVQQPTNTVAAHPLYSAQNFYSRPAKQASGNDGSQRSSRSTKEEPQSPSRNTKNPVLGTSSNNKDQRGSLPNDNLKSSSRSNVGPVYSNQYANVRHAREVVVSSEEESSTTSTTSTLGTVSTSLSRQ